MKHSSKIVYSLIAYSLCLLCMCGCTSKDETGVDIQDDSGSEKISVSEYYEARIDAYRGKEVLLLKNNVKEVYDFGHEKLYSDTQYTYYTYLGVIDHVFIVYSDGTEQNIKDALYSDNIDIQYLEEHGIYIHREPIVDQY